MSKKTHSFLKLFTRITNKYTADTALKFYICYWQDEKNDMSSEVIDDKVYVYVFLIIFEWETVYISN